MARTGRPPKPDALKRLQGTFRANRKRDHVEAPPGAPACPDHFRGFAREAWDVLCAQLLEVGILAKLDGAALEGLCTLWARGREADRHIAKYGQIVETPFGPKKNPSVGISEKAWAEFRKFCGEFGITPSARMKIKSPSAVKADPVAAEFFGIKGVVEGGKQ